MSLVKKKFKTTGMTCKSCEIIIARQVLGLPGIKKIDVDYTTETAVIEFDDKKTSYSEIKQKIEEKGYQCVEKGNDKKSLLGWLFGLIGIIIVGYFVLTFFDSIQLPTISQNMSYGLLFIVGLLTGFHCVSMCGGFVVSYTAHGLSKGKKPHQLHLSYAVGKVISYTTIGALFGLLGSIIAFTPKMRGIAGILAGVFLLLFGLKMLNIIPSLRKFQLRWPSFLQHFASEETKKYSSNPLIIGLLNGLMIACGPLQAVYIMAAGTGSWIEGAKLLFVFGLGTLPVMLGFGYLTSFIGSKATSKILKASGIIIIVLGLVMVNRGLALTGSGYDLKSVVSSINYKAGSSSVSDSSSGVAALKNNYQEIKMDVTRYGWSPDKFVLQKGVPVKWVINGKELNGCNSAIQVPKQGLNFKIKQGLQTIEFTPTETGTISWSCWMGMIPGVFVVVDKLDTASAQQLNTVAVPKGGSCGAGGGGCGCGGGK